MIIIPSSSSDYLTASALYNSIVADCYSLTVRPDLVAETAIAVRKATMKFHQADGWKNDIITSLIPLPVTTSGDSFSYRYTLDLTQAGSLPYFRKISSIDEYNNPLIGNEYHFKELDNDRIFDDYMLEDINYYYRAGQAIQLRVNKQLTTLSVDYWRYPDVTPTGYTSWIAQQFPDAIVCEATATIFAAIGKSDEAQRYAAMFAENLAMLRMTEI